jgi:two-component system sensor kinase FixL
MSAHPFGPDTEARLLSALVNSSDDAIISKDLAGTVLTWNAGAERMYGYRANEIVGRSIDVLVPPHRREEYEAILARVARGERLDGVDTVRVRKDGQRLDTSLTIWPIRDASNQVIGASIIARDVTERRQAERVQLRTEARWRAVIESAVDGIILIDGHGLIEFFNPAAERLFDYAAEEVLGRNVSMLMPSPYAVEHDRYLERYQATHQAHVIGLGRELLGRRKDGTTFPLHLSVGEVKLEGETRFAGIVRDLTERVNLEKRLREEAGLVRIGELAAVLAHEIQNPLAAVSGAIQMLGEHLTGEEDREIVQEILQRLDGLSGLMSDLLLFARPPRPELQPIDLAGLLDALVAFLRADPTWRELDITLELDASASSMNALLADAELLRIAFQNLLLNAAQAAGRRGRIHVAARQGQGQMVVDVIDSGPGIPAEHQEQLFTPFFTTKARGTGLGLPTVRRIAEAHGGSVDVHETGPSGTVVRVRLPLTRTGTNALA